MKKHVQYDKRLYEVWKSMKQRCANPNSKDFPNYGGKGICVCAQWIGNYPAFHAWAINSGYQHGLSIDRIDNGSNYSPENCRWVDDITQANNRSNNHYLLLNGNQITIAKLCRIAGMSYSTVRTRINLGWSVERIVSEIPVHGKNQFSRRITSYDNASSISK